MHIPSINRSTVLYQTHPLSPLLEGNYDGGNITLDNLLRYGNFGIGTFSGFNGGEMLVVGGAIYSMPQPTTANLIRDLQIETPFAMITNFKPSSSTSITDVKDYETFKERLESQLNPEKHYAVLVQGKFKKLEVQCVQPPHQPGLLFEKISQSPASFSDCEGILVGFRIGTGVDPEINHPGYHFHGLLQQGGGGHVLELGVMDAVVSTQELERLEVLNPP
jgi:acetolactate decarboxylase